MGGRQGRGRLPGGVSRRLRGMGVSSLARLVVGVGEWLFQKHRATWASGTDIGENIMRFRNCKQEGQIFIEHLSLARCCTGSSGMSFAVQLLQRKLSAVIFNKYYS